MNTHIFAGLQIATQPSAEPVSLDEVNKFLRLQPVGVDTDDDNYLTTIIATARQHLEVTVLKRAMLKQTWNLYLNTWPGRDYVNSHRHGSSDMGEYFHHNHIVIPMPPLRRINTISFITSTGATKTVTAYDPPVSTLTQNAVNVFKNVQPGKIVLPFSGVWPTDILMPGPAITINFDCGYDDVDTLQTSFEGYGAFVQGLKMICTDAWENRVPAPDLNSREIMNVVSKWLRPYRMFE